jgi:hypothetical protein
MDVILAAVTAAVLAGGFALLGSWQGSRREHTHWLRDARRQSYSELSAAITAYQLHSIPGSVRAERNQHLAELPGADRSPVAQAVDETLRSLFADAPGDFAGRLLRLFAALGATEIAGPADVAEAARRLKDIALSDNWSEMAAADAEFVRRARRVLASDG